MFQGVRVPYELELDFQQFQAFQVQWSSYICKKRKDKI